MSFCNPWGEYIPGILKDIPKIPRPPSPPLYGNYQSENVGALLEYADQVLHYEHGKLVPLGLRAMGILVQACYRYFNLADDCNLTGAQDAIDEWRMLIGYFASGLDTSPHLFLPPTELDWYMQDSLMALHRGALFARYGEMLAGVCVGIGCEDRITRLWRERRQRADWYQLSRCVEFENQCYDNGEIAHEDCMTYNRVTEACRRIGLDPEETFDLIYEYGFHNRYMDADIITLIKSAKDEDYSALAYRVYTDLWSLPAVFYPEDKAYISLFRGLLETCVQTWFDCVSMQDDYYIWPASWYILDYHGYQDENSDRVLPDDNHLRKEIYTRVMRGTIQDLLMLDNASSARLLNDFNRYPVVTSRYSEFQREGSIFPAEMDIMESMERDWRRLEGLNNGNGELLDIHFETRDDRMKANRELVKSIKSKYKGTAALKRPLRWQPKGWIEWDWRSELKGQARLDILPYVGEVE